MSGIPGSVNLDDDTPDPEDQDVNARVSNKLTVPANILEWIDDASGQFGVPRDLLAAVVYQHSKFSGLTPGIIAQVASRIAYQHANQNFGDVIGDSGGLGGRSTTRSSDVDLWLDAATAFAYGSQTSGAAKAYRDSIGRVFNQTHTVENPKWTPSSPSSVPRYIDTSPTGITLGADAKLPSGKFTTARFPGGIGGTAAYGPGGTGTGAGTVRPPLIPGLTDNEAEDVMAIADRLYLNYLGRRPTTAEYVDISHGHYTPQTLEEHLRAQSYGGTTVGKWQDAKALANKYAQEYFGRDADNGEINFLVTSGISAPDNISAYYEQLKMRKDSGDPAFVWAGDPKTWREMAATVEGIWKRSGLTGKVDPHLVNDAVRNGLTQDQIQERINALPAPGFPQGMTVGEVGRVRLIATSVKNELFPGDPVTSAELQSLAGMSPDDIRNYYRAIVPKGSKTGLQAGIEGDLRATARAVLQKFGVTGYEPTPEDLRFFAATGADPAAMLEHFASDPTLAQQHPGLAFGMDSAQYHDSLGQLQKAYQGVFPGQDLGAPYGATKAARTQTLAGSALSGGITPGQFSSTLESFRQERGRAPTTSEFSERFNRATTQNVGTRMAAAKVAAPTQERDKGRPRPAVSA